MVSKGFFDRFIALLRGAFEKTPLKSINAGIPGHSSAESVGRLFAEGHAFSPDFVLLYNTWNDLKFFQLEETHLRLLRPYVNVWCTQTLLPDRQTVLADMAARDVQYWCYPNKSCGENDHTTVRGARMTYGYGF